MLSKGESTTSARGLETDTEVRGDEAPEVAIPPDVRVPKTVALPPAVRVPKGKHPLHEKSLYCQRAKLFCYSIGEKDV